MLCLTSLSCATCAVVVCYLRRCRVLPAPLSCATCAVDVCYLRRCRVLPAPLSCATCAVVVCYLRRCVGTNIVDASFTTTIVRSMIEDWSVFGRVYISAQLKIKDHEKLMHVSKGRAYMYTVCNKINRIWFSY